MCLKKNLGDGDATVTLSLTDPLENETVNNHQ